jgi:hypothetical protein
MEIPFSDPADIYGVRLAVTGAQVSLGFQNTQELMIRRVGPSHETGLSAISAGLDAEATSFLSGSWIILGH